MNSLTRAWMACLWAGALMPLSAAEGDLNLEASTPAIQKVNQSRSERTASLDRWKAFGYVGEGRDGLLAVRSLEGLALADQKQIRDTLAAENDDRRALFREVLRANGVGDDEAQRVMAQFARKFRAGEKPGNWVQHPSDGHWVQAREVQ